MSPRSHLLLTPNISNPSLCSHARAQRSQCWARIALALSLLFLIGSQALWAQETTGTITGTVVDPSGATVQGASVTAKDVDRGTVFTAQTNETGTFNLTRVPIGTYIVTVTAPGFSAANYPKFALELNQTARLEIKMKVGTASETIDVE